MKKIKINVHIFREHRDLNIEEELIFSIECVLWPFRS